MIFRHNSTIGIKQRPCKSCGRPSVIFSKGRCQNCSRIEDTQKKMSAETDRLIQEEDLGIIIDDLDAIFSQFVRLSAAGKNGILNCYICDKPVHWKEAHNMHYVKRGASLYLRFDPRNNKAGCEGCNKWKDGNYIEYAKKLESETPGITDILYEEGNLVYHPTKSELKQLISEYSTKVKNLKSHPNNQGGCVTSRS